jgi:hypothetical protein
MTIPDYIHLVKQISNEYQFEIFYLDVTDNTLLTRLRITGDVFIQFYINSSKYKMNYALIFNKSRIYGIDKEGGKYHEHPFGNADIHKPFAQNIDLEDFKIRSLKYIQEMGLI